MAPISAFSTPCLRPAAESPEQSFEAAQP